MTTRTEKTLPRRRREQRRATNPNESSLSFDARLVSNRQRVSTAFLFGVV